MANAQAINLYDEFENHTLIITNASDMDQMISKITHLKLWPHLPVPSVPFPLNRKIV